MSPRDEEIDKRKAWFAWYASKLTNGAANEAAQAGRLTRCPCCRCRTLAERAAFLICPVCFWEDDGQDDADANAVRGVANDDLSLTEARRNYLQYGACDPKFIPNVRPPLPEETDTEYTI